jgi:cytochrome c553
MVPWNAGTILFFLVLVAGARPVNPRHRSLALRAVALFAALFLVAVTGDVRAAGDVKAGRGKALMCQACHGTDGISKVPEAPNIAAQTEPYIAMQLKAFKSGARKNDVMSVVAQTLSDKDIDDLAAYFSAIEIKVVKLPGG